MKVEKPEERPPEERHEQSDVPIGILTAVIVFLGLLGILSLVLLRILFVHWAGESVSFGPARIDLAIEADNQAPPPRLQVSPEDEWETWKAGELEELNRFGWVSRSEKVVKVPIERAFEILISENEEGSKSGEKREVTPLEFRRQRVERREEEESK